MKIGLLGPADGDEKLLRECAEFLLGPARCDQAIYLGLDDTLDRVVAKWAAEITGGDPSEDAFLARAAGLARSGGHAEIESLLASDASVQRLQALRTLPPPPARAIEMLGDRILLVVHDKAILDEDDIANATVIAYGRSEEVALKRFGPRQFFTPGPLRKRRIGLLSLDASSSLTISVLDPAGTEISRETLAASRQAKLTVHG